MSHRIAVLLLMWLTSASAAHAQTYSAGSDLFFYGDNTEFTNLFREGETILGISGRIFLDVTLNDIVTVRGGIFGLGRFGTGQFLEHVEPAVALHLTRGGSRFIFGSLETVAVAHDVSGPDHETPHRLLPPLQQETVSFTRGQEMGLQWIVDSPRLNHDAWINWQRLNTANHRERFDTGYRSRIPLAGDLALHGQYHLVHEGGQQFDSGAVRDSHAGAVGVEWQRRVAPGDTLITLDGHAVATRDIPDREHLARLEAGLGVFSRGAVRRGPWRTHVVVWRSRDTVKDEGDPNYLARRRDGAAFRKVRDYAEWGLTRHFRPAPDVHMFAAFRIHRVESHYEYSYRIVGRVRLRHKF